MPFWTRLAAVCAITTAATFATTISFTGPVQPVVGDPLAYDIFGAQLTQPTDTFPDWVLTIETNYPATLPGSPDLFPYVPFGAGGSFTIGDFLITWMGNDYAVSRHPANW